MTKRPHVADLRHAAVEPLVEQPQHQVLVMNWTIDPRTQRPVGYWRLATKPPFDPSLSRCAPAKGCVEADGVTRLLKMGRERPR